MAKVSEPVATCCVQLVASGQAEAVELEDTRGFEQVMGEVNRAGGELYRRLGFAETGRRKRYYRDPMEDAVQMRLEV